MSPLVERTPALPDDQTDYGHEPGGGALRPGGRAASSLGPVSDENLPSTRCLAAKRQATALKVVRDVWAGNECLHDCAQVYLPQHPREDPADYRVRLARAVFYNVFRNTVIGLTGFVFRKPVTLADDVPAQLKKDWENIDLAGTHGDVFSRDLMADAMIAGHAAILVEYPTVITGERTYADDLRFRPYWVPLTKDQLVSWRTTQEDGRTVLTQLVVEECVTKPDGMFGDAMHKQYRVFFRLKREKGNPIVGFRLLEVTRQKTIMLLGEGYYPTQREIPVAEVVTPGKRALFDSEPPLLDLAYLNLAHYRQWSDYDSSIHMTCVPLLFTAGFLMKDEEGREIPVGPNTGLNSPNPEGKADYVTHDGAALEQVRQSLQDLETRMAALGLAALATEKRAAETATAKRLDKGATDSALMVSARGLQDGLERAFGFHARYYGLDDGGSVELNTDFEDLTMDAPTMTAWGTLAEKLKLPAHVIISALIEGGRLPEDTDVEALAAEMEMAMQNEAERKRLEAMEALEANVED